MGKDVEMKDAAEVKKTEEPKEAEVKKPSVFKDVHDAVTLVEQSLLQKEARHLTRAFRLTTGLRSRLNGQVLRRVVDEIIPNESKSLSLKSYFDEAMETEELKDESVVLKRTVNPTPEVQAYVQLLVVMHLLDQKRVDDAVKASTAFVSFCEAFNRRTLDPLQAKAFFYYSQAFEMSNKLDQIRPHLLSAHRTCNLRHDMIGQATLLNLLLRNYLNYNLYEQAEKLMSKTVFPDSASNSQFARYLYYQGKIKAIQLDYTRGHSCVQQAIRKAPQYTALGFRRASTKLLVIIQLLMGEIPDRSVFFQEGLKDSLEPYFRIAKAVRVGDLAAFKQAMDACASVYRQDGMYTLIVRLRQNVIKAGLRKISLSYSRISIKDVAERLCLGGVEDCEYIVAKAIHDGVIDAVIDHEHQTLQSKDNVDIYSTQEPQDAFHKRIAFCLDIHNEAVRAMRYPESSEKKDFESPDARRERLQQELELAEALLEEDEF